MSSDTLRDIQGYLSSSSGVTDYVSVNNIKVGWPKTLDSFPCIIITRAGGEEYGYLGYLTSPAGSRVRRENPLIQIDVYSQTSAYETMQISDSITKLMIASSAARKNADLDGYEIDLDAYRKILTFSFTKFRDD